MLFISYKLKILSLIENTLKILICLQRNYSPIPMRQRRGNLEDLDFQHEGEIVEYKHSPSLSPPSKYPPLHSGKCDKCSVQSNTYVVDQVSRILGLVNLNTSNYLNFDNIYWSIFLKCCSLYYSKGIIVSPGQMEVLHTAIKTGAIVVLDCDDVDEDTISNTMLLTLYLEMNNIHPSVVYLKNPHSWSTWILSKLDVNISIGDQTDVECLVKTGGLILSVDTENVLESLKSSGSHREVLVVPSSISREHQVRVGWTGHRVRLDVGLPMLVREMVGGTLEVVHHCQVISYKLRKVTPSQLVAFVIVSGFGSDNVTNLSRSEFCEIVAKMISLLESRGVVMAFSGDAEQVVQWALNMLGVDDLNNLDHSELWKIAGRGHLETFFLSDFVVGVSIMTAMKDNLDCFNSGTRRKEECILVNYTEIVDTSITLIQIMAEDKISLPPCQDLRQLVLEAVYRAEMMGTLSNIQEVKESQYGVGRGEDSDGERTKYYKFRQEYQWEDDNQEGQNDFEDMKLVVGHNQEGRRWLRWTSGLMRFRIRNLYHVLLVIFKNRDMIIFTANEMENLVKDEVNMKKQKGWCEKEITGAGDVTKRSVLALSKLGIIRIVKKREVELIHVVQTKEVQEILKVILEFRC